jgi:DNA invertase Pin-like site-specific DNA recombinase
MSVTKQRRVALYLRVSTTDQTTENQRRELHQVASAHRQPEPDSTKLSPTRFKDFWRS